MTTHDRDKIIAAAKEAGSSFVGGDDGTDTQCWTGDIAFTDETLAAFYTIAFEDGRQAERIVTIKDDDDLRFIKRVLEGVNPTEEDKAKCLQLIREIRIRARGDNK